MVKYVCLWVKKWEEKVLSLVVHKSRMDAQKKKKQLKKKKKRKFQNLISTKVHVVMYIKDRDLAL